jgi:integrase
MPPRTQKTPYGDVTLTSRWQRDRYYLMAYGSVQAVRWMFPKAENLEHRAAGVRHTFEPAPNPLTIERELRKKCAAWQDKWNERLQDHQEGGTTQQPTVSPVIQTVHQLFDHLFELRKSKVADITTDRDRYKLNLWRTEFGNQQPLTTLSPDIISQALARIGKRTSPSTANAALGLLKTYMGWASNTGLIKDASYKTVQRLKDTTPRKRIQWWTTEQVELALRCAGEDNHQPTATLLVACGCYLGLRVEEIIMLRWQDLDLDAKDPRNGETKPVCRITPNGGWVPKDGEARNIPIASPLLAVLQKHRQAEGYLLQPESHRIGRPRGGGHGLDYRYDPKKVWARIMRRIIASGGQAITMYGMRHSFASNLLIAGVTDVKVSRWLGHSDTRMVHRCYGHLLSYDQDINALKNSTLNQVED